MTNAELKAMLEAQAAQHAEQMAQMMKLVAGNAAPAAPVIGQPVVPTIGEPHAPDYGPVTPCDNGYDEDGEQIKIECWETDNKGKIKKDAAGKRTRVKKGVRMRPANRLQALEDFQEAFQAGLSLVLIDNATDKIASSRQPMSISESAWTKNTCEPHELANIQAGPIRQEGNPKGVCLNVGIGKVTYRLRDAVGLWAVIDKKTTAE